MNIDTVVEAPDVALDLLLQYRACLMSLSVSALNEPDEISDESLMALAKGDVLHLCYAAEFGGQMGTLILPIFNALAPLVAQLIREHHAATGQIPNDMQIKATFEANIEKYLAEGAAWKAAHPTP